MNLPMRLFLMLTCLLCASVTAQAASITNVGLLPGGEYTEVHGLSGDGSVAVGSGDSSSVGGAFRWTATSGTLQNLGVLPGDLVSYATAVSDDGSVVVGRSFVIGSGTSSAYRWTATSGTMENLGALPGSTWSEARAVSSNGSTVVGMSYDSGNNDMAVRWTSGTVQSLGRFPGGTRSWAEGVSADGSVVVGSANDAANTYRAYRWTTASNTLEDLGTLPGGSGTTQTLAFGVNGDGSVVVGAQGIGAEMRAFRWTLASGTMENLGLLPDGSYTQAFAVSADGATVVGEAEDDEGNLRAFLWTPTLGMQDLNTYLSSLGVNLDDWVLESAYTVSADGNWIGGIGVYQDTPSGFVANITPVPEPASLGLAATGGLAALGWTMLRRRKRHAVRAAASRTLMVCFAAAAVAAVMVAAPAQAQTSWNAYNDFYLDPTAAGWGGATSPSATGAAWGYYMGNVNGVGAYPDSIGTYLSTSESFETTQLYRFSSVNPLNVPGPVRSQSFWDNTGGAGFARYVDNVDWSGGAHSSLGSYSVPWFSGAPGLGDGPGGSDLTNLIWMQSAYLLNPGGEGIASVLTWTAPATRTYDFSGLFVSGNDASKSAAVAITDSLGGTAPLSRTVLANDAVQSFSFSQAYNAGDVVQFQVGNNLSSGNIVGLQVSIVPEPSTYAMALAGIACGGYSMWRRRKQRGRREDDPALPSSLAPRSHSSSRSSAGNRFRTCHWPG